MNIAVITSPFCALPPDAIGAVERRWFDVVACFAKEGHLVQLIGKRDKTILANEERIKRDYITGYSRTGNIYLDILLDLFYSIRALKHVDKCDVLVANTFWGPILAPFIFRGKHVKLVYNVARFPKRHVKIYSKVDLFACTSSAVASALKRIVPKWESKICVISNPVNTDYCKVYASVKKECLVGYHGRIHKEKGLDILASAIATIATEIPQIKMKMIGTWDVGKGGSGETYKARLDELSGGRIIWTGSISNRNVLAKELQKCLVYCYPSVAEMGETFGVSPLEAMSMGLPTVVSGLECFKDFMKDGENGLVFDHRSNNPVEALRSKLEILLSNEALRNRCGTAAIETAKAFSTEIIAERWIAKFEEIING